jgi:hypothetical protein
MRVNCHVPITVRIVGVPTDDQLAAVGATLTRAVAARLAEAERLLATRHGEHGLTGRQVHEPYEQAREGTDGYAVPSYQFGGDPVALPVGPGALTPYQLPAGSDPRDPTNPHNALTAEEMFILWMRYWTARHNRALRHEQEVRLDVVRKDPVRFRENAQRFRLGRRDVYGPEYEAAAGELDYCQAMVGAAWELKTWLEGKEVQRIPVTFDQVNEAALGVARGQRFLQAYIEPLLFAGLGTLAGPAEEFTGSPRLPEATEPIPTPPRPPGGWIGRVTRNLVARAMTGLAEAEPATGLPTGSPTAIEQPQRPAATSQPAPVRPAPAPEQSAATRPAPAPPAAPGPGPSEAGPVSGAAGRGTPAAGTSASAAAPGAGRPRLLMFHGTEQGGYQGIGPLDTGRIDVAHARGDHQDLGQGFYLTLDVPTAETYAATRGRQRGGRLQHLLAFDIPAADLGVIVDIRSGGNFRRQWEDFLNARPSFPGNVRIPGFETNRALYSRAYEQRGRIFNEFLDRVGMRNADTIIAPLGDDVFTGIVNASGETAQVCVRSQRVADRLNQQIRSGE